MNAIQFFSEVEYFFGRIVVHYEKSSPQVSKWANDLYVKHTEGRYNEITLSDIAVASCLCENGHWLPPNYAQNRIYKLLDRQGKDTTGWIDH
jgi:hypothetical protein